MGLESKTKSDRHAQLEDPSKRIGADAYFSADVETDGPIPGVYSILSFAFVYAGSYDGCRFQRPPNYQQSFYREVQPISEVFQQEALNVNGLDRQRLYLEGTPPQVAMIEAYRWITEVAGTKKPVLVAYPLSFDWAWLYWYFIRFSPPGSPFHHSRCFDIKTAFAIKAGIPISEAGRQRIYGFLKPGREHVHRALDDAIEQAEMFANVFEWGGANGRSP